MFRRSLAGVLVVVVVLMLGAAGGPVWVGVEWLLFGYLVWRAAPGVGRDLRRLRLPGLSSLRRSRRGELL